MIKIENLTKSYRTPAGRHYVFKDLNIEIPSGKSVAFIGRNGAGKSTLLRMIGGIDRPDSGKIITNKTIMASRPRRWISGKFNRTRKRKICCAVIREARRAEREN